MSTRGRTWFPCLTAASLTLAACTSASGAGAPAAPSGGDVGIEHVHGLGVDPADGVLYAATHFGLWRIPGAGEAYRVADRYQDTMGFTVVGPRTFLGSGHPDFQKDPELPTRLGLIRSSDAGESWQAVSLGGSADLHVLEAVHGRIYGWDAEERRVLVSDDDGATWDTRGILDLRDLAVSPADPEFLLATTEVGVMSSVDGGRSWAPIPDAPPVVVLAWAAGDSLYGVTPAGEVMHSVDGGTTWLPRGTVTGEPEALALDFVDGIERLYVAVAERGILTSSDGGVTFAVRYAE